MLKKNVVEIVCILDRSGSMSGLVEDTIEGFNKFLQEQREVGPGRVTLVLFDSQYEVVYEDEALSLAPELTGDVYYTRGTTALMDAVGKTIARVKKRHMSDRPEKTMFLIITDGYENASVKYVKEGQIKMMVGECIDDLNWGFFYLGANVDAFNEAGNIGIPQAFAANYDPTKKGTQNLYAATSQGISMSRGGSAGAVGASGGVTMSDLIDDQSTGKKIGDDDDGETA